MQAIDKELVKQHMVGQEYTKELKKQDGLHKSFSSDLADWVTKYKLIDSISKLIFGENGIMQIFLSKIWMGIMKVSDFITDKIFKIPSSTWEKGWLKKYNNFLEKNLPDSMNRFIEKSKTAFESLSKIIGVSLLEIISMFGLQYGLALKSIVDSAENLECLLVILWMLQKIWKIEL